MTKPSEKFINRKLNKAKLNNNKMKKRKRKNDPLTSSERKRRAEERRLAERSGMSKKAKRREAQTYRELVESGIELTSDLFGIDDNDDNDGDNDVLSEPPSTTITTSPSTQQKKGKGKKMIKKEKKGRKKGVMTINDDPFDIHGFAEKTERKAAWVDHDDVEIKVKDVAATKRNTREPTGIQESSEQQYSIALQRKFTQVIGGTPDWASLDRKEEEEDREEDGVLTMGTGDYLSRERGGALQKSRIHIRRVCPLNYSSKTEGAIIRVVEFNPHLPMALVGGFSHRNGTVTMFEVDGERNHKIQSVRFPDFPVRCAKFLGDGKKFLATTPKNRDFCCYNMETGQLKRFPANVRSRNPTDGIKRFVVSPSGNFIVTLGFCGVMDVFDGRALSHTCTFYAPEEVFAVAFSDDGSKMYSHGGGGDVCVWDMNTRQCVHRFYDDGCMRGTSIAISGNHLACGSSSGIVNLYDTSQLVSNPTPTPVKALSKLLTPVSSLAFNSTSEILATVSDEKEEGLKLVHFPSMTYFENFPINRTMHRVQTATFSPLSGYLATGDNRGTAQLFRLQHYKGY